VSDRLSCSCIWSWEHCGGAQPNRFLDYWERIA